MEEKVTGVCLDIPKMIEVGKLFNLVKGRFDDNFKVLLESAFKAALSDETEERCSVSDMTRHEIDAIKTTVGKEDL